MSSKCSLRNCKFFPLFVAFLAVTEYRAKCIGMCVLLTERVSLDCAVRYSGDFVYILVHYSGDFVISRFIIAEISLYPGSL